MTTNKIFKELILLSVPEHYINQIKILYNVKGCIIICCVINDIIVNYNSTNENNNKVTTLLNKLCKNYFNQKEK